MEERNTHFINQTFTDVDAMRESSLHWKYQAVYKLMPDAFKGENSVVLLPSLQLSYAKRSGGILYNVSSPKGTLSLGVVTKLDGKACYGTTKLNKGDILFFDDKVPMNMVTSDRLEAAIVSIPRKGHRKLTQQLAQHKGKIIRDTDGAFANMLLEIAAQFANNPALPSDSDTMQQIETKLLAFIEQMVQTHTPYVPKLTKGEKIALEIRDRIYKRITKKVTIASFAREFGVSEQTLQNAFKSLFGITPNKFLRNLKLNHVRTALLQADPQSDTIIRIANRWGFTHMGHFSRYYTDLFGENPSVTLARKPAEKSSDNTAC